MNNFVFSKNCFKTGLEPICLASKPVFSTGANWLKVKLGNLGSTRHSYIFTGCLMSVLMMACTSKPGATINAENTSAAVLREKPVIVKVGEIETMSKTLANAQCLLVMSIDGDTIPSQLDDLNGDGEWDELFFLSDFDANETKSFLIETSDSSTAARYKTRTNVRFAFKDAPNRDAFAEQRLASVETETIQKVFQMEGPAWENDVVAFRNYYDARNGMDIFGKTTTAMALDGVGINGQNYHEMDSWGMDILKVGNSLGAGAIALLINDSLYRVGSNATGRF
ncbi:MAG: DUF4861 domain-containing protein [Bacteroidales bacterium]|nr:DUF4861 domain-containing protein [Bacteroidales bacterium]